MAKSRATIGWLLLAAAVVLIDQLTKALVEKTFRFGERRTVIPDWFDLTLVYNKGAAFSFLSSADGWQRWFFIALGTAAAVVIVFMLVRHGSQRLFGFGLAMILGGAVGNVIDRVWRGQVVDFLEEQARNSPEVMAIGYRGESQSLRETGGSIWLVFGITILIVYL
ncbi:MAG TPA: signal peptidase II, partial [Burkholderiaceae bacterium]|nr:signal peptidase II [Burkholderiaceae bacterium]